MTKEELRNVNKELGISVVTLSKELGIARSSLYRYFSGIEEVPKVVSLAIETIKRNYQEQNDGGEYVSGEELDALENQLRMINNRLESIGY